MAAKKLSMDRYDYAILDLLQRDATLSLAEIAERVKLSPTPCWLRIQRLESEGVIRRRVALLDAQQLNVGVTVYVAIRTSQHNQEWFKRFAAAISSIPEVMEFYRVTGDVDYLLKVVVPDIAGYDAVYKKMISRIELEDVSSSFAMEQLKYTTELPLEYAR
jgi:Lrp/AsnC family transcriptional regulator